MYCSTIFSNSDSVTGPATISTMVIYAEKTRFVWQLGVLVAVSALCALGARFSSSAMQPALGSNKLAA